jgi:Ca2+-binding EF-hand superfamily protein
MPCLPGTVNCKRSFEEVDTDSTGGISLEEFTSSYPEQGEFLFDSLDGDGSGILSPSEYSTFVYCRTPGSGDPYCP